MGNKVNCFEALFEEGMVTPKIQAGINVEIREPFMFFDGITSQRLFIEPVDLSNVTSSEDIEKFFADYDPRDPWVGQKNDKYSLFSVSIDDETHLLKASDGKKSSVLVKVLTNRNATISPLYGKVLCKMFKEERQEAIVEMPIDSVLTVNVGANTGIVTWNGQNFIIS